MQGGPGMVMDLLRIVPVSRLLIYVLLTISCCLLKLEPMLGKCSETYQPSRPSMD